MKILWNAQYGAGWDQRISTRDVCVVTRQPLLMALIKLGHEITFTNPPVEPTLEDMVFSFEIVNQRIKKLNADRVEFLNKNIKVLGDFDSEFRIDDYDFAITELRTELYFHESRPKDVEIQRKIWESKLPCVIWDKDLWGIYENQYINRETSMIVGPTLNYGIANPGFGGMHKRINFGIDDDLAAIGSLKDDSCIKYGYIGSQYNREDELFRFYSKLSRKYPTRVVGKMYDNVKHLINAEYLGRTPILSGKQLMDNIEVTVHIAPKYYSYAGHITHRIYETTASECCLLADSTIRGIEEFICPAARVFNSNEVDEILKSERKIFEIREQQREYLPKRTFTDVAIDFENVASELIQ